MSTVLIGHNLLITYCVEKYEIYIKYSITGEPIEKQITLFGARKVTRWEEKREGLGRAKNRLKRQVT